MVAKHDLEKLSIDELKALMLDVERAIKRVASQNLKKAREAAEGAARQFGFSLDEVTGNKSTRRKDEQSGARFRNPENPEQTWSGRGRQPQWFKEALAGGRSRDDLIA
jgi:DNA-binding protein H-NS